MLVFVMPPSLDVLKERLFNRATETEKSFQTRVKKAEREMDYAKHADRILVNDRLEVSLPEALVMANDFLNQA
jgi:guanylate kinase